MKSILVRADGTVEELKEALLGRYFIQCFRSENGDWWEREYEVFFAVERDPKSPDQIGRHTAVGIERSCRMRHTLAEIEKQDAERRARVMKECLWGIRNYPGDDEAEAATVAKPTVRELLRRLVKGKDA